MVKEFAYGALPKIHCKLLVIPCQIYIPDCVIDEICIFIRMSHGALHCPVSF